MEHKIDFDQLLWEEEVVHLGPELKSSCNEAIFNNEGADLAVNFFSVLFRVQFAGLTNLKECQPRGGNCEFFSSQEEMERLNPIELQFIQK